MSVSQRFLAALEIWAHAASPLFQQLSPTHPLRRHQRYDQRRLGASQKPSAAKLGQEQARRQNLAFKFFEETVPVPSTLGEDYLASRQLAHLANSGALGFHHEVPHPNGSKLPALLALVVDAADRLIGIHRTYLAPNGGKKASVDPPKASLGPVSGGVRLEKLRPGLALVIGEGLETAASTGILFNNPAWAAAVSAGNLAYSVVLPPEVKHVIIAVNPDVAGHRAAAAAGERWRREGRRVRFAHPDGSGDFNDVLCASTSEAANA